VAGFAGASALVSVGTSLVALTGVSLAVLLAAVARVVRRRGAAGASVVALLAAAVVGVWASVAADVVVVVVALRRARVARRGCAVSPVMASSAGVERSADAFAEVSAPVGAACACCAVTFRVRVVRRGGRRVS
jgi:uncharacterized membrane protein